MIQVRKATAERLKHMKAYARQSYDELINQLIQREHGDVLTEADVKEIKRGLDDISAGRTASLERVAQELGVRLRG